MANPGRWRHGLALTAMVWAWAQGPSQPEYRLKARFLARIADYTEWPRSTVDRSDRFVIGLLGHSKLTSYLEEELSALGTLKGRRVEVMKMINLAQVERCHLLFICESEFDALGEVLDRLRGKPILTVADSPGFATRGVMVNVMVVENRLAIEMNLTSLHAARLSMESRVQARAVLVGR